MRAHDTTWLRMDVQRLTNELHPRDVTDQLLAALYSLLDSDPSFHGLMPVDVSKHESNPHSLNTRPGAFLLQASKKFLGLREETDWDGCVFDGFVETFNVRSRRWGIARFKCWVVRLKAILAERNKLIARSIQKLLILGNFVIPGGPGCCPKLLNCCLNSP